MSTGQPLTIVVPTHNRPQFLRRLLRYYRLCGAPYPLHILDSSEGVEPDRVVEGLVGELGASYRRYEPGTGPVRKLADGVGHVATPYTVLWADDDLMVPRTMEAGVRFLEAHPDYSVAHGHSGLFQLTLTQGCPSIAFLGPYRQPAYRDERAGERLLHYFRDSTTLFYSVHRTANLQRNLSRCHACGFGDQQPARFIHRSDVWAEQLLGCLSLVQGKAEQLDGLYLMRERHAGVDSWEEPTNRVDTFGWVTSPSFSSAYDAFSACLSGAIVEQERLSLMEAREAVKRAFWAALGATLSRKWQVYYGHNGVSGRRRWRDAARRVPGLRRAWRAVRALMPGADRAIALEALLRPSSRYAEDFMPIYRAITTPWVDGARHKTQAEPETVSAAVSASGEG